MSASVFLVLSTIGSLCEAEHVAKTLVREHLAACVNLIPKIQSIYEWNGELCEESEVLLVMKTAQSALTALQKRLKEIHPYKTPEIIALPVELGAESYLAWVVQQTGR